MPFSFNTRYTFLISISLLCLLLSIIQDIIRRIWASTGRVKADLDFKVELAMLVDLLPPYGPRRAGVGVKDVEHEGIKPLTFFEIM